MTEFVHRCRICNKPLADTKRKFCPGKNNPCSREWSRRQKRLAWENIGHNGRIKAA